MVQIGVHLSLSTASVVALLPIEFRYVSGSRYQNLLSGVLLWIVLVRIGSTRPFSFECCCSIVGGCVVSLTLVTLIVSELTLGHLTVSLLTLFSFFVACHSRSRRDDDHFCRGMDACMAGGFPRHAAL